MANSELQKTRKLRVFLSHSSVDRLLVQTIAVALRSMPSLEVWISEENLIPGQHWEAEVIAALRGADVVIVFFSREGIQRKGFLHKELRIALETAACHPDGSIFVIPVRLNACPIPQTFSHLHYVSLFEMDGFSRLLASLEARGQSLGISVRAPETNFSGDPFECLLARLSDRDWQGADQQTALVLLHAANRLAQGWLDPVAIAQLPSDVLLAVDSAWKSASDGRFCFSSQARIWNSVGTEGCDRSTRQREFESAVGWRDLPTGRWRRWGELVFGEAAVVGHLPTPPRWWELWEGFREGEELLFGRLEEGTIEGA